MFRGDRMASLREELGLSQSELARRIGVSPTTIWKLENDPAQGSKHTHRIARELRTSAAYLSDETDDPQADGPEDWLTAEEREAVEIMRALQPSLRKSLLEVMRGLLLPPPAVTLHSPKRDYKPKG